MNICQETLAQRVFEKLKDALFIELEASGRHVHLTRDAVNRLFGEGYHLTPVKELSQPGQFMCRERVAISTEKGTIKNVAILGPERPEVQVEVSKTDCIALGVNPPVRQSGDTGGSPGIVITGEKGSITASTGLIVAQRHVHMTPEDAKKFGVRQDEIVRLKTFTSRPLIFDDVVIRVSDKFRTYIHIDYDEANACGFTKGDRALILKKKQQ